MESDTQAWQTYWLSPGPSGHTAGLHFPASPATRDGHVTVLPNQMHVEVTFTIYSLTYCPPFYLSGIKMALGQTQPHHGSPNDGRQLPSHRYHYIRQEVSLCCVRTIMPFLAYSV